MASRSERLLLNADVGEGLATDSELYPYLDQASIACGGHAGDENTMAAAVTACRQHSVAIGAHPSYPDRENFGRVSLVIDPSELQDSLQQQVSALQSVCDANHAPLCYVKPHGALYNDLSSDTRLFMLVLNLLAAISPRPALMIGARPDLLAYQQLAADAGVQLIAEVFADRRYLDDGRLSPRKQVGAVFSSEQDVLDQCRNLVQQSSVVTVSGARLELVAQSLCLHGDNPTSVAAVSNIAKLLRR